MAGGSRGGTHEAVDETFTSIDLGKQSRQARSDVQIPYRSNPSGEVVLTTKQPSTDWFDWRRRFGALVGAALLF